MDFIAVGYPSPLTTWGFLFLEKALRRIMPNLSVLHLDRYDTVTDPEAHPEGRLILSMFPSPAFAEAARQSDTRSLIFADDPTAAVQHMKATHAIDTYEALRPVAAGLVMAGPFARSQFGLVVGRDLRGTPSDILRTFLEHFGLDISDETVDRLCLDIGFEESMLAAMLHGDSSNLPSMSEEERHVIVQALGGLHEHLQRPNPGDVTWPRQCFLSGDRPNSMAPVAVDVTGRARIIFYGPYLHLPRGHWKVRVLMGFSQDIRGMPFLVEVASTEPLGKARIFAERGGIFEFEFEASVTAPHEPIEVRIMNEQGAIEGHMGLVSIDFKEWSALPEDMPSAA